ncbi:hypothetical protein HYS29_02455 [Candidatus Microgenomates bacterium]|nr:hypothetical protein [Candidatus Microgenomates bacterium]MBI2622437.1 hypothetical protein [Candidatus Microgenomates bacterium]
MQERGKFVIPLFSAPQKLLERVIAREEGWSLAATQAEDYYEKQLFELQQRGVCLIYLCAPLKPTPEKTGKEHILSALSAAAQITGAEYKERKTAVWIPHYHALFVYNEFRYPEVREMGLSFTINLLARFKPVVVVFGERISGGMQAEITKAQSLGLEVVPFTDFKHSLQNPPTQAQTGEIYNSLVSNSPPGFLDHPALLRTL